MYRTRDACAMTCVQYAEYEGSVVTMYWSHRTKTTNIKLFATQNMMMQIGSG